MKPPTNYRKAKLVSETCYMCEHRLPSVFVDVFPCQRMEDNGIKPMICWEAIRHTCDGYKREVGDE